MVERGTHNDGAGRLTWKRWACKPNSESPSRKRSSARATVCVASRRSSSNRSAGGRDGRLWGCCAPFARSFAPTHHHANDVETKECERAASRSRCTPLMQHTTELGMSEARDIGAHRHQQQRIAVQGSRLGPPRTYVAGSSRPGNDKLILEDGTESRITALQSSLRASLSVRVEAGHT